MQQQVEFKTPQEKKALAKMKAYVLKVRARKTYKVMLKRSRYRRCVIQEINKTESDYIRDLNLVITHCMQPIAEKEILTSEQAKILFMNIDKIAQFNQSFYDAIQNGFANYFPYKTVFGQAKDMVPGFQIYFDFCNGYTESSKLLTALTESNKAFETLLGDVRRSNVFRGMGLDDFLVKPVQRMPKYVLLFKDLLKNTDQAHPDYQNIKKTLHEFEVVNDENNKNMDKFMNRMQIQELDKLYNMTLMSDPNRLLRFQETQTVIWENHDKPCQIIAMTDVILVTFKNELGLSEVLKTIYLDSCSFVKDQNDNLVFKNLQTLVGKNDVVQFTSEDIATKKKFKNLLEALISELRVILRAKLEEEDEPSTLQYPIQVSVVGTEERNFQSFKKHTIYITEVKILKIVTKIFVRYSEIKDLCEEYKKRYKQLSLPNFSSKQWINNSTELIEQRKLAIENFLQVILSAEATRNDGKVLDELHLPKDFQLLPDRINLIRQQTQSFFQNELRDSYRESLSSYGINTNLMRQSASEVWKARKQTEEQDIVHISKLVATDMGVNQKSTHAIEVVLTDNRRIKLGIANDTRAAEIVAAIAEHIQLKAHSDFRIFLVDQLSNARMIDDDEVIWKVINDESEKKGILTSMVGKIETIFFAVKEQRTRLEMRKVFKLPFQLEEYDFKRDPVRLKLMAYQVFQDVYNQVYHLDFKEYCFFAALYIYSKEGDKFHPINPKWIKEIIPVQVMNSVKESRWKENILDLIKQLSSTTNQIGEDNIRQSQLLNNGKPVEVLADPQNLTLRVVLNTVKFNKLYNITQFFVEIHGSTKDQLKRDLKGFNSPNIYLGIAFDKICLLTPSNKSLIREYSISKISQIQSYPMQIVIHMLALRLILKFETHQSYEIKTLIEEYQELQKFREQYNVEI